MARKIYNFKFASLLIALPKFFQLPFIEISCWLFFAFAVVRSFVIVMRWFEVFSILSMFLVHFYFIPLMSLQKLNWSVSKLKLLFKSPTCFEDWEKRHKKEIHNVRIELNFAAEIRSICSIQVLNNYKICLCRWMWIYRASCMRTLMRKIERKNNRPNKSIAYFKISQTQIDVFRCKQIYN